MCVRLTPSASVFAAALFLPSVIQFVFRAPPFTHERAYFPHHFNHSIFDIVVALQSSLSTVNKELWQHVVRHAERRTTRENARP